MQAGLLFALLASAATFAAAATLQCDVCVSIAEDALDRMTGDVNTDVIEIFLSEACNAQDQPSRDICTSFLETDGEELADALMALRDVLGACQTLEGC